MPRTIQYTRDDIIPTALELVREHGAENLSARNLSKAMGCSTTPLFTCFKNIEEIRESVREAAIKEFTDYVAGALEFVPAFKEYGMRMIRYAIRNPHIYKFLFMNRTAAESPVDDIAMKCLLDIRKESEITEEQVKFLSRQIRTYVIGIIALIVTGAETFTEEQLNKMIGTQYIATMMFIKSNHPIIAPAPRLRKDGEGTTIPFPPNHPEFH